MLATRLILISVLISLGASTPDWTDCPSACSCKWTSGKKSALCRHAGFTTIPDTLDSDMQVLDLTGNSIPYLTKNAFKSVGLLNLQRIFLKGAGVRELHRDAFKDLTILVEVDLSDNLIATLHQDTFSGNDRLKVLYLNGNPLTTIKESQFPQLPHLRSLEMQHCQISSVHRDAFTHLPALESLNLNGNRLKHLSESAFLPISKLKSLSLDGNPWRCDCDVRGFRNWLLASNLYSHPLTCTEPPLLKGLHWEDIDPQEFACPPMVYTPDTVIQEDLGENMTLRCRVEGDPEPLVTWYFNNRPVANSTWQDEAIQMIETENGHVRRHKWSYLFVVNVSQSSAGDYTCHATNLRGSALANLSLVLSEVVSATTLTKSTPWADWIITCAATASTLIILLIAVSFIVYRLRQNKRYGRKALMKSSGSYTEQDKKLLDVSITTTTDRQTGSCEGIGSHADVELLEQSLQAAPLEVCDQPVHITIESHPAVEHGVSVYQPPPEFSTSIIPSATFGNIFISVSVTQEPTQIEGGIYPDLLDLPHRKSVAVSTDQSYYATLPLVRRLPESPQVKLGPKYDNMGPRVTAAGSSTISLPDSGETPIGIEPSIVLPSTPESITPIPQTSEYVSL
ncbi:hypothetical protein O3M35_004451 [Rhynocoris fuscipes]|uniref:Ig-like domain-containing protein n=1 Tax=Rhynocoris fuscipes TaxID=488301 RepID=A0AAW1CFW1_9HEMI